jgi:hypothetical protein
MTKLDDLAHAGEERQRAEVAAKPRPKADPRHRRSDDMAAMVLSSSYGWYQASLWIAGIGCFFGLVFLSAGIWEWVSPGPDIPKGSWFPMEMTFGTALAMALLIALPFWLRSHSIRSGRVALVAEENWMKTLPFQVTGYFEMISRYTWIKEAGSAGTRTTSGTAATMFHVGVRPSYLRDTPPREWMGKLLDGLGKPFGSDHLSSDGSFHFKASKDIQETAREIRKTLTDLFVPLHEQSPLRSVDFHVES